MVGDLCTEIIGDFVERDRKKRSSTSLFLSLSTKSPVISVVNVRSWIVVFTVVDTYSEVDQSQSSVSHYNNAPNTLRKNDIPDAAKKTPKPLPTLPPPPPPKKDNNNV